MASLIQRFTFVAGRFSRAGWTPVRGAALAATVAALAACGQPGGGLSLGVGGGVGLGGGVGVGVGAGATVPLIDPGIGNGEPGAGV